MSCYRIKYAAELEEMELQEDLKEKLYEILEILGEDGFYYLQHKLKNGKRIEIYVKGDEQK